MTDTIQTPATTESQDVSTLPQWARDQITDANAQAAKYRVEKNSAVEAAKTEVEGTWVAKYAELETKVAGSAAEVVSARTDVVKLKAALGAGIDTDKVMTFASLLKGETEDELKSHADEVKKLFATSTPVADPKDPPVDPSQGSGNPLPLNGDPLLTAVMNAISK